MKKGFDFKMAVIIIMLVACVGVGFMYFTADNKHKDEVAKYVKELNESKMIVDELSSEVEMLGETMKVYRLKKDVKSGEKCLLDMLEAIEVPASMCGWYVEEPEDLVGKYFLIDVKSSTPLTSEMLYSIPLKSDQRTLDVICDRKPVGFRAGDTVDVRITFPDGQDYLMLNQKLVDDVWGNVVRIVVDEKDILIYKSAEADWARFHKNGEIGTAVQIYCISYIQGGLQDASRYYPIANVLPDGETFEGSVLWTALHDENLKTSEADLYDWTIVDRQAFEEALVFYDQYRSDVGVFEIEYYNRDNIEEKVTVTCARKDIKNELTEIFGRSVDIIKTTQLDSLVIVDMKTGAEQVNAAKLVRDEIYAHAVEEYKAREQARKEAEDNGEEFDPYNFNYEEYQKKKKEENGGTVQEGVIF